MASNNREYAAAFAFGLQEKLGDTFVIEVNTRVKAPSVFSCQATLRVDLALYKAYAPGHHSTYPLLVMVCREQSEDLPAFVDRVQALLNCSIGTVIECDASTGYCRVYTHNKGMKAYSLISSISIPALSTAISLEISSCTISSSQEEPATESSTGCVERADEATAPVKQCKPRDKKTHRNKSSGGGK